MTQELDCQGERLNGLGRYDATVHLLPKGCGQELSSYLPDPQIIQRQILWPQKCSISPFYQGSATGESCVLQDLVNDLGQVLPGMHSVVRRKL